MISAYNHGIPSLGLVEDDVGKK